MLFVGEKRSQRAIDMDVTWKDGALAAKQLFDALVPLGIDPRKCDFCNLFEDGGEELVLSYTGDIIGMGKIVQQKLEDLEVEHFKIVHPAARGKIRRKDRYAAHLKEALKGLWVY
jgi:hypothetical protein